MAHQQRSAIQCHSRPFVVLENTQIKYNSEQESPAVADKPARCKTMPKIAPI